MYQLSFTHELLSVNKSAIAGIVNHPHKGVMLLNFAAPFDILAEVADGGAAGASESPSVWNTIDPGFSYGCKG